MANYRLTKDQWNELFRVAAELNLDRASFRRTTVDDGGDTISRLDHPATGGYLQFGYSDRSDEGGYVLEGWPVLPSSATQFAELYPFDWPRVLSEARGWFGDLRREIDAPDLWELASSQQRAWLGPVSDADEDRRFQQPEAKEIKKQLDEIEALLLKTFVKAERDRVYVRRELKYLRDGLDRLSRRDWKGIVVSTLIGIATNLAVDTETGRQILDLSLARLGPFFQGASRLLKR